jgi:hypothetical protein
MKETLKWFMKGNSEVLPHSKIQKYNHRIIVNLFTSFALQPSMTTFSLTPGDPSLALRMTRLSGVKEGK